MAARRPFAAGEAVALVALAAPIAASLACRAAMSAVDAAAAGRISAAELAGVALGAAVWSAVFYLASGMLLAAQAALAFATGQGDPVRIRAVVGQILALAGGLGVLGAGLLFGLAPCAGWLGFEPQAATAAEAYLRHVAWALPGATLFQGLRYVSEGLSRPLWPMAVGVGGLLLHAPLSFALAGGALGPALAGAAGCGVAASLSAWAMAAALATAAALHPAFREVRPAVRQALDPPAVARLAAQGLPIGLTVLLETGMFSLIAFAAGALGARDVAAHQIAMSLVGLLFVAPLALSMALAIRVARWRGAGRPDLAARSAATGFALSALVSAAYTVAVLQLRERLPGLYTADPAVAAAAAGLLAYAVAFLTVDALGAAAAGALRAYGETRPALYATLVGFWLVALPLGGGLAFLAQAPPARGVTGLWIGLSIGLGLTALALAQRLARRLVRDWAGRQAFSPGGQAAPAS